MDGLRANAADGKRWDVEFLGVKEFQEGEPARGGNWRFRATLLTTGETKTFHSGTHTGWYIGVRNYNDLAVVEADVGSGAKGFTIYDLEADVKVVEFYTLFPHWSPDGRYLVYRKFMSRGQPLDPGIKVIDLTQEPDSFVVDGGSFSGVGVLVFPLPAADDRPELLNAYGTVVTAFSFNHVKWDVENGILYFAAPDRTNHLNLLVVLLEPEPLIACIVPLVGHTLVTEYFPQGKVFLSELELSSPNTVVVATKNSFGVRSEHGIQLREACLDQNQVVAEEVSP